MGRKKGITKDEYRDLIKLDRNNFSLREWTALIYAREWTYAGGAEPSGNYGDELGKHFSREEQDRIRKLLRMMLFANYCGNGFYRRPWKKETQVCDISWVQEAGKRDDEV